MNNVPRPRNDRKPKTSVSVVMNTDDASAGSTFSARNDKGMSVPAVAATQARADTLRAAEQQASVAAAQERFIRFIGDGHAYAGGK